MGESESPDNETAAEPPAQGWRGQWRRFREFVRVGARHVPKIGGAAPLLLTILVAIVIAVALLWVTDKVFYIYVARSYVADVADALDLNPHLANALILATFAALAFFGRYIFSFSRWKRRIGILGVLTLLIGHSLVLWVATQHRLINRQGLAERCYVISRDGNVTYGEHAGIDPATGRECRPVTPDMVERLTDYVDGKRPQLITTSNPTFFDPRSGEPIVWYYKAADGTIELYDLMGFQPDTGAELLPVTEKIVQEWKKQSEQRARLAPKLITDPNNS